MVSNAPATEPWIRRPIYKFGMLLVLGVLAVFHAYMIGSDDEPARVSSKIGLIAVIALAVNHISLLFFRPLQQRRAMPLQVILIVGGLGYVSVIFWQQFVWK